MARGKAHVDRPKRTCRECKTLQPVHKGSIIDHTIVVGQSKLSVIGSGYPKGGVHRESKITVRCHGSGLAPAEDLAKSRERAREKRRSLVLAARDEASVILDAILAKRTDLDEEFPKARREKLLDLALVGYRLDHPGARKINNGILWWSGTVAKGVRANKLFCRFCGFMIARFPIGIWIKLTDAEKVAATERHVMICALQYLAGIRTTVVPGTKLDGYDGELWDEAITRQCNACGSLPGITCVSLDATIAAGYTQHLSEPHEARRYA